MIKVNPQSGPKKLLPHNCSWKHITQNDIFWGKLNSRCARSFCGDSWKWNKRNLHLPCHSGGGWCEEEAFCWWEFITFTLYKCCFIVSGVFSVANAAGGGGVMVDFFFVQCSELYCVQHHCKSNTRKKRFNADPFK